MKRYFDYLLGFFVFFSAVFYIPGQNFIDSQAMFFKIGVLILFAISLCFKPSRNIVNVWVNGFLMLAIASFCFNKDSRAVQVEPMVNVVLTIMLFYILLNYLEDTNLIYGGIVAIIIINFIMVLAQLFKIDPLCLNDVGKQNEYVIGLFGHPMNLGAYIAVVLPYLLYKNKWFFGIGVLLLFSTGRFDIAAKSWAGILSAVVGVLLYIWLNNKKLGTILISSVVFVGLVGGGIVYSRIPEDRKITVDRKVSLRIDTQYPLVKAALSRPWLGCGLGTFKYIVPQIKEIDLRTLGGLDVTWNDYLGCMLEVGVFSLFIFFGFFRETFRKFYHTKKTRELNAIFASLATIPLGIFFHSYMNYINIAVICIAMYVLFETKLKGEVNYG